ncbi:MAG: ABC transporter ATP-binding protein [Gemmataceae bacterium]
MIDVRELSFTYPKTSQPALRNLSFAIEDNEIFGFLGPSGSGKSTTQKILIGLLKEYTGHVDVLGMSLSEWGHEYYEQIGVSFELPNHYLKLTAKENLDYFRSLYSVETEAPMHLLELVGLADDADKPVSNFSKGMKNRLNVARSLLNKPKVLFLDEPTAGLDPVNARRLKDLIAEVRKRGTTIFLTTHNMMVADELCDRVAFLVDGEIKLIDFPRELKLRYGTRTVRVECGQNGESTGKDFGLNGLAENTEFLDMLRRDDLQTIHTQETTLDNIFIQVTGRELV